MDDQPMVFIVDDDPEVLASLAAMVTAKGVFTETYCSAEDFLANFGRDRLGCLVTDIRMPGMSGLDLQERLQAEGIGMPVIIITGYGDIPAALRAMRTGAVTFLEKPCRNQELWENIEKAIAWHRQQRRHDARRGDLRRRFATLTEGEHQVLEHVMAGKPNKVIAATLDIGLRTVELRRARAMKKLGASCVAELVRLVAQLEPRPAELVGAEEEG